MSEGRCSPNHKATPPDRVEGFLKVLFSLLFCTPMFAFIIWYFALFGGAEVIDSKPIGYFISMSGPGGFRDRVVIETDLGSFPLLEAPVISKGTSLVLEVRRNGDRFVCDVPRQLCIKTAANEFNQRI